MAATSASERTTPVERKVSALLAGLLALAATGCGDASVVNSPDASDIADAGNGSDSGDATSTTNPDLGPVLDAATMSDAGEPPDPRALSPCDGGDCWNTSLGGPPCATSSHDEDFSSGTYNIHDYATVVWDDTPTHITLTAGAGAWEPVLVIGDAAGVTLFDGDVASSDPTLTIDVVTPADVSVTAVTPRPIHVFVTSRAALESGFVDRIPTDATYSLTIESDCGGAQLACVVNGNAVREPACGWLHYVGRRVVPRLGGSRDERLDDASLVAWWALKEGVMFLDNPIVYSNCNFPSGDARIGPLESCVASRAWQVGLSGVQVPYHTDAEVDQTAAALYPDETIADVLRLTATEAQLDAASIDAVVASTKTLRRSWLLRNSAIGFTLEAPVVRGECVDGSKSWCYGTGWDTTQLYAPTRSAALGAIDDVRALFDQLAP